METYQAYSEYHVAADAGYEPWQKITGTKISGSHYSIGEYIAGWKVEWSG
jgi:hypothetical protein